MAQEVINSLEPFEGYTIRIHVYYFDLDMAIHRVDVYTNRQRKDINLTAIKAMIEAQSNILKAGNISLFTRKEDEAAAEIVDLVKDQL